MNFNATRTRLAALAASLALAGCGGTPAPNGMNDSVQYIPPTGSELPPEAQQPAPTSPTEQAGMTLPNGHQGPNDNVQYFPKGPEFPYANTQAAVQRARMAAQGVPIPPPPGEATQEQAADPIRDGVQRTAAEVARGAEDLQGGVTRAVGEAQAQAGQAANDAVAGAKGFAAEARDEATQAVTGAVGEVKSGVADTVNEAKAGVQSAARKAKDSARNQVKSAVDGAKDAARRQAEAAGAEVRKSAEGLKDQVLDGLLGPAPK